MAEYLSERELRVRRRDILREDTEIRIREQSEKKLVEVETLRRQIEQRRAQRLRQTQSDISLDIGKGDSYTEELRKLEHAYSMQDDDEFSEGDDLHVIDTTGYLENENYETEVEYHNKTDEVENEIEKLNIILKKYERGKQDRSHRKDEMDYSEDTRRKISRMSTRSQRVRQRELRQIMNS